MFPSEYESNQDGLKCQHNWTYTHGQNGLAERKETIPPRSKSLPQKTNRLEDAGKLRLSDKKDLTSSEISVVAPRLVKNESVAYFLKHCRLIYENLMPLVV
jgi:hypothetical protein